MDFASVKEQALYKSQLDEPVNKYKEYIDYCNECTKWGNYNEIATYGRLKVEVENYYRAGKILAKDYNEYIKTLNDDISEATKSIMKNI